MKLHKKDGLTILWRGALESCNYDCGYCPFAKTQDTRAELTADRKALERFVGWAIARPYPLSVLFTPWGEALIRNYYRDALIELSHAPNIQSVAIQTNLSCSFGWITQADLSSLALWITYHPGETPRAEFLKKIYALEEHGVRYSVGIVALKAHFDDIRTLRDDLPSGSYLWINAYMPFGADVHDDTYYTPDDIAFLTAIDPYFELNTTTYPSRGRACFAGETVISVDGDGVAKRCHFIKAPIGNIYARDFEANLKARACTQSSCSCHIGYSHLKELDFKELFGNGLLERRPQHPATRAKAHYAKQRFLKRDTGKGVKVLG